MKAHDNDHHKWVDKEAELLTEITQFFETIDPFISPYMRMHQRMPWF